MYFKNEIAGCIWCYPGYKFISVFMLSKFSTYRRFKSIFYLKLVESNALWYLRYVTTSIL